MPMARISVTLLAHDGRQMALRCRPLTAPRGIPSPTELLFTSESGSDASFVQATPDYPSTVEDISGIVGRAAYEGVQADGLGRLDSSPKTVVGKSVR